MPPPLVIIGDLPFRAVHQTDGTNIFVLVGGQIKDVPIVLCRVIIIAFFFFFRFVATTIGHIHGDIFLDQFLTPFSGFGFFFLLFVFIFVFRFIITIFGGFHLFIVVIDFVVPHHFGVVTFNALVRKSKFHDVRDHVVVGIVGILHDIGKGQFGGVHQTIFIQKQTHFETGPFGIAHQITINEVIIEVGIGFGTGGKAIEPFHRIIEFGFDVFTIFIVIPIGGRFMKVQTFVIGTHLTIDKFQDIIVFEFTTELAGFG